MNKISTVPDEFGTFTLMGSKVTYSTPHFLVVVSESAIQKVVCVSKKEDESKWEKTELDI